MEPISKIAVVPNVTIAASTTVPFLTAGEWIIIERATGPLQLQRNQDNGVLPVGRGDCIVGAFTDFFVINPFAADVVASIWIGSGPLPVRSGVVDRVCRLQAESDVICGAGAVTQVGVQTSQTWRTWLSIATGAAGPLRLGDSLQNPAAAKGVLLFPGTSMAVEGSETIYAYNANASSVTCSLSQERTS